MRFSISAVVSVLVVFVWLYAADAGQWSNKAKITDTDRRVKGYLYSPGHGRRTQILDSRGRIVGYVDHKPNGRLEITDTRRRKVGQIEGLLPE